MIFKKKPIPHIGFDVEVTDGVMDSPSVVGNGKRPVYGCNHLRQTAGFKPRWHEDEIGSGVRVASTIKVYSPGELENTNNPLDIAISGVPAVVAKRCPWDSCTLAAPSGSLDSAFSASDKAPCNVITSASLLRTTVTAVGA